MKLYKVLLVRLNGFGDGSARVSPSPFMSDNPALAKAFADNFNERELREPVGIWAVVAASIIYPGAQKRRAGATPKAEHASGARSPATSTRGASGGRPPSRKKNDRAAIPSISLRLVGA